MRELHALLRSTVLVAIAATGAFADKVPAGFQVVESSQSPDKKLVVIRTEKPASAPAIQEKILEVATGNVIATIAVPRDTEGPNSEPSVQWSNSGKILVWSALAKWGSTSMVVVELDRDKVVRQTDVRAAAVRAVVAAVKQARPKQYAEIKKRGAGDGAWWVDGLAIDVGAIAKEPPLAISITFTANPKSMEDWPAEATLDGTMTGTYAAGGQLTFGKLVITSK